MEQFKPLADALPGQLCTPANGHRVWEHKQVSSRMPWCLKASQQVCFSGIASLMASFHLENHRNEQFTESRGFLWCNLATAIEEGGEKPGPPAICWAGLSGEGGSSTSGPQAGEEQTYCSVPWPSGGECAAARCSGVVWDPLGTPVSPVE